MDPAITLEVEQRRGQRRAVEPPETSAWARPSATARAAWTIEASGVFRTAKAGSGDLAIEIGASTTSTPSPTSTDRLGAGRTAALGCPARRLGPRPGRPGGSQVSPARIDCDRDHLVPESECADIRVAPDGGWRRPRSGYSSDIAPSLRPGQTPSVTPLGAAEPLTRDTTHGVRESSRSPPARSPHAPMKPHTGQTRWGKRGLWQ